MATSAQKAGLGMAGVFAALAIAVPELVANEGWKVTTYTDPVGISTACAGVTGGVQRGKTYTELDCQAMTSEAALRIANAIRSCTPGDLSPRTEAAFISIAYNIGAGGFCRSSISRKALAGDLPGACAAISRYVYAGNRVLPGLVARRAQERKLCEEGLRP